VTVRIVAGNQTDWPAQIRRYRRLQALKQATLAEAVGVDQSTISRWESGGVVPDSKTQQRLLNLMRCGSADERLLRHAISVAPNECGLSTRERTILAASSSYCAAHGVSPREIVGKSARPMDTAEAERLRHLVCEEGFFRGEIASVTVIARTHSLSGHHRNRPTKAIWIPVRLKDGDILLRVERLTLPEDRLDEELRRNGGQMRIVRMDDLRQ
jgi:transcriptional regulator with XRE-family HTH domain